jgi:hypothetical protein
MKIFIHSTLIEETARCKQSSLVIFIIEYFIQFWSYNICINWFLHCDMFCPLFLAIIRDCVNTARVSRLFLHSLSVCQLRIYSNLATVKQNSVYCNSMPSQHSEVTYIERTRVEQTECTVQNKIGLVIHVDELHNNFSMPSNTLKFTKYFKLDYGVFTESDKNYLIK